MNHNGDTPESLRFERKYVVSEMTREQTEHVLCLHPALFSEIYHQRLVNNIYFDSPEYKNYFANVDGLQHRVKCRIRWYGDLFGKIDQPVLELKIKNGLLGRKESYKLASFVLDRNLSLTTIRDLFDRSELPAHVRLELKTISPSLLNRYCRKYFQSADRRFRITVDSQQEFYRVDYYRNTFLHRSSDHLNLIVELKYDQESANFVHDVSSRLPFRMSKNSKYVNGIQRLMMI